MVIGRFDVVAALPHVNVASAKAHAPSAILPLSEPREEYERNILGNLNKPDIGFRRWIILNYPQRAFFEINPTG